ncbi:hypothetical protein HQ560_04885 [bacterium]|nr:hypothetical protein [bacterium]
MKRVKMIVVAVLLVILVVLVVRNQEDLQLDLVVTTVRVSRTILLLVTFLVGACCGLLLASRMARRGK